VRPLALHTRLTVGLAGLLIVLAVVLVVSIAWVAERYRAEMTQRLNAGIAMYVTNELKLVNKSGIDKTALRELSARAMTLNPSAEVYLLNVAGDVIATPIDADRIVRRHVDLEPVRKFISGSARRPLYGNDPTSTTRSGVFSVAPLQVDGSPAGYLYVMLASNRFSSITAAVRGNYSLRVALLLAVGILSVVLVVAATLFRKLTLPLRQLAHDMRRWSTYMDIPVEPVAQGNEIVALNAQFRVLADRIAEQLKTIAAQDAQRCELIANVSHDLRTPLASLHGYLETVLLKGEALAVVERTEYLQTARRHSRQLERLIEALFELSKLESGFVELTLAEFSLSELVSDVVQKYQLRALQANVSLVTDADRSGYWVRADLALVERVLSNLLDNALRHTPSRGRIQLLIGQQPNHIQVVVLDSGNGIATEDLPHVFERHFRGRGKNGGSAGLGLAIAKRIVELHGQKIEILSRAGQGVRVAFGLPQAGGRAIFAPMQRLG
jgi:signal transduction histidine kinase